ncbi:zinc finger protein 664-like [Battus philenor]|uniref:zinc finger protein 664-like n=1 Tax=Battus philenor TaxID=42288 RepID=UPI0035D0E02A
MVTSYYIMKMSNNKNKFDTIEYYTKNNKVPNTKRLSDYHETCRICLKEGEISIYGNENSSAILDALNIFTDIELKEDDGYSKLLCRVCHKFLQGAILFRKTAKESEAILRRPIKEEFAFETSQDHDYTDSYDCELKQNWGSDEKSAETSKREKVKHATKVTCHVCDKVVSRSYFKEHLTMHDPNHQKYVCDVCGKSFRLRCAYHNHSLRHRDDFHYKCQFCPYKGRYAELLKTHMRTHTGDYRYMCTECPARFLFKSNLNSHMLKHKEPQFKCDTCKRAFHTHLLLRRHHEVDHLGIKNHVCNMCGKAFGYRNAMMKHQRHVHKREKLLFGRMPSYLEAEQKYNEDG